MLGCGTTRVVLTERGGGRVLDELDHEQVSYGRVLSEQSEASIDLPACGQVIPRAWEHEIGIYRDDVSVWVGPVTELTFAEDGTRIQARDLSVWFERRLLGVDRSFRGVDLSRIYRRYAQDALEPDPSPGIVLSVTDSGVAGDRDVLASDFRRAADEMRELARSAIDWTMLGRVLLAGPRPERTVALHDEHMVDPSLSVRGLDIASQVTVVGSGVAGGPPVSFTATGSFMRTGLLATVASESSILDTASAAANARGRLALLRDEVLVVETVLTEDAPVAFEDLVPGLLVDLAATIGGVAISARLRLRAVRVRDNAGDEEVSVTLTSPGEMGA